MKKLMLLPMALLMVFAFSCNKNKSAISIDSTAGGEEDATAVAFVCQTGVTCDSLAGMDNVTWFTIVKKSVNGADSEILYAQIADTVMPTNVIKEGKKNFSYLTDAGKEAIGNTENLAFQPGCFEAEAVVTEVLTGNQKDLQAAADAEFAKQQKEAAENEQNAGEEMKKNALAFFKACEQGSGSFANYCTRLWPLRAKSCITLPAVANIT